MAFAGKELSLVPGIERQVHDVVVSCLLPLLLFPTTCHSVCTMIFFFLVGLRKEPRAC